MPEQPRIERILYLKKGADKNRDAQKPSGTTNERRKPGQMNEAPPRLRQRWRVHRRARLKAAIESTERKNSLQPHKDADRVNDTVVNHDRLEKAALQIRRTQQRLDDRGVVPDVECAAENLRNNGRKRSEQKTIAFARPPFLRFHIHKMHLHARAPKSQVSTSPRSGPKFFQFCSLLLSNRRVLNLQSLSRQRPRRKVIQHDQAPASRSPAFPPNSSEIGERTELKSATQRQKEIVLMAGQEITRL